MRTKLFLLLTFTCLLRPFLSEAQERALFNVKYEFSHVRDLSDKSQAITVPYILTVGKYLSRYCPESIFIKNSDEQIQADRLKRKAAGIPISIGAEPEIVNGKSGIVIREEVIKDLKNKGLDLRGDLGTRIYKVSADLPQLAWKPETGTKTIDKYSCQRASINLHGRSYYAWFSRDIPIPSGPWLFYGLPGMILEVEDQRGEVAFRFVEIKKITDKDQSIKAYLASPKEKTAGYGEYNTLRNEYEEDPASFISRQAAAGLNAAATHADLSGLKKISSYNPLDKP